MRRSLFLLLVAVLLFGCQSPPKSAPISAPPSPLVPVPLPHFDDITTKAGIHWAHNACRTGKKLLPETVGGGGGFLDYDNDGHLDILLINSAPLPGYTGPLPHNALYRNNGDGTFTEVTVKAGIDIHLYGMGATVADYDNDGWPDIFLTAVGTTQLLHNEHGHFVDVTQRTHTGITGFTTAAAWIDYDHDGRLDLYVGRYVEWTPETDLPCGTPNARQYCPPHQYHAAPPVLLHQRTDGTFEDTSQKAGILGHSGKTLGVAPYDFNGDGWIDLYVANDTEPDVLLINNENGTFTDRALESGVAVGTDSSPTGSMGTDVATPFADGKPTIATGVFAGQQLSLFVAQSPTELLFDNRKQEAGVALPTDAMTTFGLVYADVNGDGWPDIVIMNGHIDDDPALTVAGKHIPYKQMPQLFLNQHNGTFQDVAGAAGLNIPMIGRGLAVGDIDNDGKPDLLTFENGGPVRLWHNTTPTSGDWLGVRLIGKKSPRDGTGAMVTVSGKGWQQTRCVTTIRSYLSTNDIRLLFGVPTAGLEAITVHWPGGQVSKVTQPARNRYLTIRETD